MIGRRGFVAAGAAGVLALGACRSRTDGADPEPTTGGTRAVSDDGGVRRLRDGADPSQFAELSLATGGATPACR